MYVQYRCLYLGLQGPGDPHLVLQAEVVSSLVPSHVVPPVGDEDGAVVELPEHGVAPQGQHQLLLLPRAGATIRQVA